MISKFKVKDINIGFDFDVEFVPNQKVNCIIGKNGIGKTQLLENMAKSLFFSHMMFTDKEKVHLQQIGIYEKIKKISLILPLNIEINGIKIREIKKQSWKSISFERLLEDLYVGDAYFIPLKRICNKPIVFIGAKNRGFTKNIDSDNIKILAGSQGRLAESLQRTMSYINGEGLENEEVANWFVSRLIINPNFVISEQNKSNEVITVLKLIERLEPSLKLITKDKENNNQLSILYKEGELLINNIPINKLSTGFVSIIKIFQEIVAGYGGWSNQDDLSKVDAIVFIDEIEPHLHINWQIKIVGILKEFFPNTTFYITTHSPLILAGLKDGEAYELYQEEKVAKTKKIENIDNYFLNDIVKEFFDVDLNQNKIDNPNKEKHVKAKSMLLNLAKTLSEDEK